MKKIFMASICAIMAVTAANADIASTTYVDGAIGDLNVTQVGENGSYIKFVKQDAGKVSATPEAFVAEISDTTKASTVAPQTAAVVSYVEGELSAVTGNEGIAGLKVAVTNLNNNKVDKAQGTGAAQKLMNTDDKGNVVAAGIVDDAGNATGANYVTGLAVNAKGELVVSKGKIDVGGDIEAAIASLGATVNAEQNKVITSVTEENGKLKSVESTSITSAYIENETIVSEDIKNGEVKTDDIANLAVTAAKLADNAVTAGKISATKLDSGAGEGKYALTANVDAQGNITSYSWEFIGR